MTAQVHLVHVLSDDDEGEMRWGAEAGLDGSSSGTDPGSTTDVAALVSQTADDVQRTAERHGPGLPGR